MSANTEIPAEDVEFSKEITRDIELFTKELAKKYNGKLNDVAVVLNWTSEQHARHIPKIVIETLRGPDDAGGVVDQALQLSELLSRGSEHIMKQMVRGLLAAQKRQ
jgi:hypothetical protein